MEFIDAHHHLWNLDRYHYPWLANNNEAFYGSYEPIRRNYLIDDFLADVGDLRLVGSVHVQAQIDPSCATEETAWLQHLADTHPSGVPNAIVAYADFSRPDAEATLAAHAGAQNLRGIRQILNRHPDPRLNAAPKDYLRDPAWVRRFGLLERYRLSFDLQIYYPQAADAAALARRYANVCLILNHAGMPVERGRAHELGWRQAMAELAACPNIAVKISGLGMAHPHWSLSTVRPYVEYLIEVFGTRRCMFASNFPVDRLFVAYRTLWDAYVQLTDTLSTTEKHAVFVGNATRYYRI